MGSIYLAKCIINNKFYVGQTMRDNPEDRINSHLSEIKSGSTKSFHNSIRKYGIENFIFCWLHWKDLPKKKLNQYERYYIWLFDLQDRSKGYNMTEGGDANPMDSPEVRKKYRKSLYTPECQAKLRKKRKKRKGWKNSPGFREMRRQAMAGENNPMRNPDVQKKHKEAINRPEVKEKQSARILGGNNPMCNPDTIKKMLKTKAENKRKKEKEEGQTYLFELD